MHATLEGGCACGEVRYRLDAPPMLVHCCHCLNCQKHTGSAFVINLLIEASRVALLRGTPEGTDLPANGGTPSVVYRCPRCRVAVWSVYGGRAAILFVRGGSLDTPAAVAPDVHIYTRSKLPWVRLPEGVQAFEAYYDPKALWPAASQERRRAALAAAGPPPAKPGA
jgi:hypothetical protein